MSQVEGGSPQPDQSSESVEIQQQPAEVDYKSTKHRVKIDGNELEIPYEELLSGYQLNKSSKTRFDEAAKMRKGVEDFVSRLKEGDFSVLEDFVPKENIRNWAEKELTEYVQWEELPEYEKKRIIAEQERDKYKRQIETREQKELEEQRIHVENQASEEIDNEISEAIEILRKSSGFEVPVTAELVQDIARLMLSQLQEGNDKPSAHEATKKIWDRYRKKFGTYVSSLSSADLRGILTPSQLKALRNEELENAMSSMPTNIRQIKSEEKPRKQREKQDVNDFFAKMDKKYKYGA